jgi:D-serine deaminase-like pyridoxal phosphate-dependent protein
LVQTPALLVYPEIIDANIHTTLRLLAEDVSRWRPHVKTIKLRFVINQLIEHGVKHFKCATTLELLTCCQAGASDVLIAFPVRGANARRVQCIASQYPTTRVSVLIEDADSIATWAPGGVELFIDVNPGMNRTGIDQERIDQISHLVHSVQEASLVFRGLHYYEGHLAELPQPERTAVAHRGYNQLMKIVAALKRAGTPAMSVITSGTPTFICALSYGDFHNAEFKHQVSPGTLVYGDINSLGQLPSEGYRPAVVVLARVISRPSDHRLTCDAGHKALAIDCGVPNCAVLGHLDMQPRQPSEEHLPIDIPDDAQPTSSGDYLYLVPRHVCPTVNNFDDALLISQARITAMEHVTARGHERPIPKPHDG